MNKRKFWRIFKSYFTFGIRGWFIEISIKTNPYLPKGTIIDIETTGLKPRLDNIVTMGLYKDDRITIFQLVKPQYDRFWNLCHRIAQKQPRPLYAYAAHFERDFLKIPNGWKDLTRYYQTHDDYYDYYSTRRFRLIDITSYPYESQADYDIDGKDVPKKWAEWIFDKNLRSLMEIAYHNYVDLSRERQLIQ